MRLRRRATKIAPDSKSLPAADAASEKIQKPHVGDAPGKRVKGAQQFFDFTGKCSSEERLEFEEFASLGMDQ
jgi:hypothetical protein